MAISSQNILNRCVAYTDQRFVVFAKGLPEEWEADWLLVQ